MPRTRAFTAAELERARVSSSKMLTYGGETMNLTGWSRRLGVSPSTLTDRIHNWGVERALTTPKLRSGVFSKPQTGLPVESDLYNRLYSNDEPACARCGLRGEHECLPSIEFYAAGQAQGRGEASLHSTRKGVGWK